MSLLKRFFRTYITITVVSIVIFALIAFTYVENYSKSEVTRISGITKSVRTEFIEYLTNLSSQGENISEWIENFLLLQERYNFQNGFDILNVEKKIREMNSDFIVITNGSGDKEFKITDVIDKEESKPIIEFTLDRIKSEDIEETGFLYGSQENCYFVYVNKLNKTVGENGYIILITEFSKGFVDKVGKIHKRDITIEWDIEEELLNKVENYDDKMNSLYYKMDDTSIISYTELETLGEDIKYYLIINESITTKLIIKEVTKIFLILFVICIIVSNIVLYLKIRRRVVNRIVKINKEVNKLVSSNMDTKELTFEKYDDEITSLTKGINNMLKRIEKDEEDIIAQGRKNSRLLESMSNAYMYLEFIKNDNGEVVDSKILEFNEASRKYYKVEEDESVSYLSQIIDRVNVDIFKILNNLRNLNNIGDKILMEDINLVDDIWVNISITYMEANCISVILSDITNVKSTSEKLKRLLNTDEVTKLHSRYYLVEKLKELSESKKKFLICCIDLDNFKVINDTIGHNRGDKILEITANSLVKLEDENTKVCRIGGDEFVVLKINSTENISGFADEVMDCIRRRVKFNDYSYNVKASMGIVEYPQHSKDPFKVMQYADVALYESKYLGGDQYKIFDDDMMENFEMDTRLKQGIDKGELEVYYQPIYSTESSRIVGAEALVRWNKGNEIVSPDKFIGLAKKNGDIVYIDEFVLKNACIFCKERISNGDENFNISVNISYKYFSLTGFIQRLEKILKDVQLPPSALKLEITEDDIIGDYSNIIRVLKKVRRLGVKIALDDFGIGYSSFKYIKNLPIDTVKLDKSLILNIEEDKKSEYIINTLINLCDYLDLDVVCEGVEQKKQLDILKSIKCANIQGFYISKPINKQEFMEIFKKQI